MQTVFITGATGFVGSHTARRLLDLGWHVRALVRSPDKPGLLPSGAQVVPGELTRPVTYQDALNGCDAVLHVAGLVKARRLKDFLAVNADGARAIAEAANQQCPQAMFVLVSSQAAAGPARDGVPLAERDEPRPVSWYGQSKLQGERNVEETRKGPWCIVRPSVVYGAGDPGVLELFRTIEGGIAPVVAGGQTRVQLLAVEDLVQMLLAALTRPELAGRRLFAAGPVATTGELIRFIAGLRKRPAWCVPVPAWMVRVAGSWESLRERITGTARPFNRDKAREMLQRDWLCDGDTLQRAAGLSDLCGWQDGIRALCRCYVAASRLRSGVWAV